MRALALPIFLAFLSSAILKVESANIVFFHSLASYSHQVVTWPLAEALAAKGHEVMYITSNRKGGYKTDQNITFIAPERLAAYIDKITGVDYDVQLRVDNKVEELIVNILDWAYDTCEALYSSPDFQQWLASNPKVDLMVIDNCYQYECGAAIAYKLGAKFIGYGTIAATGMEYDMFGFNPESSVIPQFDVTMPKVPMNFFGRMYNAVQSIRYRFWHVLYSAKIDHYIRNKLEIPEMPYIGDLVREISLMFYTDDVIAEYPRSMPPNYVNIACVHCKESTTPLPKEIESFIQRNTTGKQDDGFVYISLGSIIISSNLPENIKKVFFDTIKSFPNLKFLWKWNGDLPKEIPDNLYLAKWFPQNDILAHPKIQAFVTQNGRPSTLEALYNGVPMISFPCIGDQDSVAVRVNQTGAGVLLEIGTVTVDTFKDAIQTQAYSPEVKARMKRYKTYFRDKPMTPLETAIWWTEYVLRTDDTSHLRPAGFHQNWFVRRQIDVWAFLSISIFLFSVGVITVLVKIARTCLKTDKKLKQN